MHYSLGPLDIRPNQRVVFHGTEILPLAPKTFDLLLLLVSNVGEVVSRETLRDRIWPDGFVEEAVISRSVSLLRSKLRPYLGDAEFIETVPKRGYRYIGEVRAIPSTLSDHGPAAATPDGTPEPEPLFESPSDSARLPAAPTRPTWTKVAIALALVAACATLAALRLRTLHGATTRPTIAVMNLQDLSGTDATGWIGVALQAGLESQLSAGPGAHVTPAELTATAERALGPRGARALSAAEVHDAGQKLNARLLLTGTYLAIDNQVRLDLVLRDVATGRITDQWSATVPQNQLNAAVHNAGAHVRTILKLAPLTHPPSLPFSTADEVAASFYAQGMNFARTGDSPQRAAEALSKAVTAKPQFAKAHAELSIQLTRLGEGKAANDEAALALATAANLPEKDRLLCQATAYSQLTDYSKAVAALTQLHQLDPTNPDYIVRLAEQTANNGDLTGALALLTTLPSSNPQRSNARMLLALADISRRRGDLKSVLLCAGQALTAAQADQSRFEQAQALVASGSAWSDLGDFGRALAELKNAETLFTAIDNRQGAILALLAQSTAMQHHDDPAAVATTNRAREAADQTGEKPLIARSLLYLGNIQLTHSEEDEAEATYKHAIAVAETIHDSDIQLAALSNLGTVEFTASKLDDAVTHTQQALQLARKEGALSQIARCTGQLGNFERYRGDLPSAVDHLRESADTWRQLGQMMNFNDGLYETGEALLAQGKLREARAFFQRIDVQTMSLGDASLLKTEEARLTAAEGDERRAESMAANSARTANSTEYSVFALDLLADLELQHHNVAQARATIDEMSAKLKLIPTDEDAKVQVTLLEAQLAIQNRDLAAAQQRLNLILPKAVKAQDKELLLRAKLTQGQLDQQAGHGTGTLQSAVQDTCRSGFGLLAQSAAPPQL